MLPDQSIKEIMCAATCGHAVGLKDMGLVGLLGWQVGLRHEAHRPVRVCRLRRSFRSFHLRRVRIQSLPNRLTAQDAPRYGLAQCPVVLPPRLGPVHGRQRRGPKGCRQLRDTPRLNRRDTLTLPVQRLTAC